MTVCVSYSLVVDKTGLTNKVCNIGSSTMPKEIGSLFRFHITMKIKTAFLLCSLSSLSNILIQTRDQSFLEEIEGLQFGKLY